MTVFTFLVFMVIMISSVRFINRQFRATVNAEAEAIAFRLADDGIDYTLFLLGAGGATIPGLINGEQPLEQTVVDPASGNESGTFSLTFEAGAGSATETLHVTSVGESVQGSSQCYTIEADVARVSGSTVYVLTSWSSTSSCPLL